MTKPTIRCTFDAPAGNRYHPSKETRRLVPLKDGMAYVDFHADGPNRVFAMIMSWWGGIEGVHDYVFRRENGSWCTHLLRYDGSALSDAFHEQYRDKDKHAGWGIIEGDDGWRAVSTSLEVIVPKGVFAKPPPAWEAAWVNHWFRHAPLDECD